MKHLISLAWDWGRQCFGAAHMSDSKVRTLRALEELTELAQSLGVPEHQAALVISTVYSRPAGKAFIEMGDHLLTSMVLLRTLGVQDPEPLMAEVLMRCYAKRPEDFAKRNQEKIALGLGESP